MDLFEAKWFRIKSGELKGQVILSGWMFSAIKSADNNEWLGYASCPLCYAMVVQDSRAYGDLTRRHEQWHANNDFPIPKELLDDR